MALSSGRAPQGVAVLGYAVTPLHPGVGRSPGAVDLPVQRDPMGYPVVYASSIKGAFKAECGRRAAANGTCFNDEGRIDCDRDGCCWCCCFFGHEPGSQRTAAGVLDVLDFVPLFFPVPSLDTGYVYLTTPFLARRASSILEAAGADNELKRTLDSIAGLELGDNQAAMCAERRRVYVSTSELRVQGSLDCRGLSVVEGLGGLAEGLSRRLVVVSDSAGPSLVERGMVRLTRVRLRLDTKTVSERALWTEEYIPAGTVFLGGFIAVLPRSNPYCGDGELVTNVSRVLDEFREIFGGATVYAIIGGKETVGKGLIKLVTL